MSKKQSIEIVRKNTMAESYLPLLDSIPTTELCRGIVELMSMFLQKIDLLSENERRVFIEAIESLNNPVMQLENKNA